MVLPIPVKKDELWAKVKELLGIVNENHTISLDRLLEIFPNADKYTLEELARKRGPLVLHGNNTFSNDGVKVSFEIPGIKTPLGQKDFSFYIESQLNGIYSLNKDEFKLTFDKDYAIKLLRPVKAYIKALFIREFKIFISLEGFLVPDIMIYKPEK